MIALFIGIHLKNMKMNIWPAPVTAFHHSFYICVSFLKDIIFFYYSLVIFNQQWGFYLCLCAYVHERESHRIFV